MMSMARNKNPESAMVAMALNRAGQPLMMQRRAVSLPAPNEVRIRVSACAVCRTDLHVIDGDLPVTKFPIIPGHEIVGNVDALGAGVNRPMLGQRVGVPWLGGTCGHCHYCHSGQENLCDRPQFTGYSRDGGFATHVFANSDYCFALDDVALDDVHAAPLLCAGLIGWRALTLAGEGQHLGIYGFGAAAHLIAQVALNRGQQVYAFTRDGDRLAQAHARRLGVRWAGPSSQPAPRELDAAIIFAPVGELVPIALRAVRKGGVVVCGGIHMTDIPAMPYGLLWGERHLMSVANLTRADGEAFLAHIRQHPVQVDAIAYPLSRANDALDDLRQGRLQGAAVLVP